MSHDVCSTNQKLKTTLDYEVFLVDFLFGLKIFGLVYFSEIISKHSTFVGMPIFLNGKLMNTTQVSCRFYPPKSSKILLLGLPGFDVFSTPQYGPANRACRHVYQIHQTPPAALVGFRTVSSQAMDALHLLLYQFHQSPTIAVPFYCMLMGFAGFGMVPSQNASGVRDNVVTYGLARQPVTHGRRKMNK